ncbi:hypothetical protein FACS189487_06760 [Campylobacterota bacterium]|nr:hypothetical protein FACS189487_06760 [Campylobacterota bacterium]
MRILGIDMGIASLGWALIEWLEHSGIARIVDCGVRIFTAAEHPKDNSSLALPRREARLARRRLRRKRERLSNVRKLFVKYNLIAKEELDQIEQNEGQGFYIFKQATDIYRLRHEALSRKITTHELARILTHIAKHRGFKYLTKAEEKEDNAKEGKKVDQDKQAYKAALQSLKENYAISNAETIGSYLYTSCHAEQVCKNTQRQGGLYTCDRTRLARARNQRNFCQAAEAQ